MELTFSLVKKNLCVSACIQTSIEEEHDIFPNQKAAEFIALDQANIYIIHHN